MATMEQTLYRFFDNQDRLLYVGITNTWYHRFHQHEKSAGWFSQAAKCTFTKYPDREAVIAAENLAIQTESPIHNKAGNPAYESPVDHFQKFKPVLFGKEWTLDGHDPVTYWIHHVLFEENFEYPRVNTKWAAYVWFSAYNAAKTRDGFECRNCEAIFTTSMYRKLAIEARDEANAAN